MLESSKAYLILVSSLVVILVSMLWIIDHRFDTSKQYHDAIYLAEEGRSISGKIERMVLLQGHDGIRSESSLKQVDEELGSLKRQFLNKLTELKLAGEDNKMITDSLFALMNTKQTYLDSFALVITSKDIDQIQFLEWQKQYDVYLDRLVRSLEREKVEKEAKLEYISLILASIAIIILLVEINWVIKKSIRQQKIIDKGEHLRAKLIATSIDGFLLINKELEIIDANDAYCSFSGYMKEELLTMSVVNIEANANTEDIHEKTSKVIRGERVKFITKINKKDGTELDVEVNLASIENEEDHFIVAFIRDIHLQLQYEQSLEEYKILVERLQGLAHFGIWQWEIKSNTVTWTDELFKIYGLDENTFKASFEAYLERVHPNDRERVQKTIGDSLETQKPMAFEERIIRPSGEVRYLKSWGGLMMEGNVPYKMFGACLDVTELVEKEQTISFGEEKFKRIFESITDGYLLFNLDGVIDSVNPSTIRLLRYTTKDQLVGKKVDELIFSDKSQLEQLISQLKENNPVSGLLIKMTRYDGKEIIADISIRLLYNQDLVPYAIESTFRDYTEKQRAQQMIEELNNRLEEKVKSRTEELEKALTQLKLAQQKAIYSEKLGFMGEVTAGLAHEINNPANFISGGISFLDENFKGMLRLINTYSGVTTDANIDAETIQEIRQIKEHIDYEFLQEIVPQTLKDITKGVDRLCKIVDSFNKISEVNIEQFDFVDLNKVAESCIDHFDERLAKIELITSFDKEIPRITCSQPQLILATQNILDNAIDALEEVEEPMVKVSVSRLDQKCILEIEDNGPGIPKEIEENIFTPLTTTKEGHLGMGLFTSYNIIHKHGGEIIFDSEKGIGTKITIVLQGN